MAGDNHNHHVAIPSAPGTASLAPPSAPAPKLRSCVTCRARKVACDKGNPCTNCRKAQIACVLPEKNQTPRWARRLERLAQNGPPPTGPVAQKDSSLIDRMMLDRVKVLESENERLNAEIERMRHAVRSAGSLDDARQATAGSSGGVEAETLNSAATGVGGVQNELGRLVLENDNNNHYRSSAFWSRMTDVLGGDDLMGDDSDSGEDEGSPALSASIGEIDRSPAARNSFLFRHNQIGSELDLSAFLPLPSQIPFLLEAFAENVNLILQIVHMPTINKLVRGSRGKSISSLNPSEQALMFSIFYSTIISMEEDDVVTNFGQSKMDLALKYRLGFEHALSAADFVSNPDLTLVQAFTLFLSLVRRHDSPRFVWMMTGLVIRMSQYLGLNRDGENFPQLTPYDIEMRRRVWWVICMLDMRSAEDQGTTFTIGSDFDTKLPLNINDEDISPETNTVPTERKEATDMVSARMSAGLCGLTKTMMAIAFSGDNVSLEEKSRLLDKTIKSYELQYLQKSDSKDIITWTGETMARLVSAKLTLLTFLPVLFSSPSDEFSETIRTKLLIAAVELAEYNHALNANPGCRQWRWVYQTCTHWHAIVYILLDVSRRPWSPLVERSWVALHSRWLIPTESSMEKKSRISIPLRSLMTKARKHREAEVKRLQANPDQALALEMQEQTGPVPSSSGLFEPATILQRWRNLVAPPPTNRSRSEFGANSASPAHSTNSSQPTAPSSYAPSSNEYDSGMSAWSSSPAADGQQYYQVPQITEFGGIQLYHPESQMDLGQNGPPKNGALQMPQHSAVVGVEDPGYVPWLWSDAMDLTPSFEMNFNDFDMSQSGDVDWNAWIENAKGISCT